MKINTLGPQGTDSYRAAKYLKNKLIIQNIKIKLHDSFHEIFEKIGTISGEYILIPAAYRDTLTHENWTDLNFKYWNLLQIEYVFKLDTMPMILLENKNYLIDKAVIHPSTAIFLKNIAGGTKTTYFNSKPIVLKKFIEDSYHFSIVSEKLWKLTKISTSHNFCKIKTFEPTMVWVLYKVEGKNNDFK